MKVNKSFYLENISTFLFVFLNAFIKIINI